MGPAPGHPAQVHLPVHTAGVLRHREPARVPGPDVPAAVLVRQRGPAGGRLRAEPGRAAGVGGGRPDRDHHAQALELVRRRAGQRRQRDVLDAPAGGEEDRVRRLRPRLLPGQPDQLPQGRREQGAVRLRPGLLQAVGPDEPAQRDHPAAAGVGPLGGRPRGLHPRQDPGRGRLEVPHRAEHRPHHVGPASVVERGQRSLDPDPVQLRRFPGRGRLRAQPVLRRPPAAAPGPGAHGRGRLQRGGIRGPASRSAHRGRDPDRLSALHPRHRAHHGPDGQRAQPARRALPAGAADHVQNQLLPAELRQPLGVRRHHPPDLLPAGAAVGPGPGRRDPRGLPRLRLPDHRPGTAAPGQRAGLAGRGTRSRSRSTSSTPATC